MRNGKLTTIIYIRHKNSKGQEVSGYIDYAHRLKSENFEPYHTLHIWHSLGLLADCGCILAHCHTVTARETATHGRTLRCRYFERKKRLMPHTSDLSFYNWETQTAASNPTPNFQIIADNEAGLLFKNKRDRKVINVDPMEYPVRTTMRSLSVALARPFAGVSRCEICVLLLLGGAYAGR